MNSEDFKNEKDAMQEQIDDAVSDALHDYKTNRFKNPWFWIGVGGIILAALGIDPQSLTSWDLVLDNALEVIKNPVAIFGAIFAILGVFVDPTTKGIKDRK